MATDKNIIINRDRYKETRNRIKICRNNNDISDREIVEYLAEEIEQYRNRIKEQNRIIDELSERQIQSEEVVLDTTENDLIDENVIEIISTTQS